MKGHIEKPNTTCQQSSENEEPSADNKKKYLFVLSPPWSGSTLLHNVLATSPNVSFLPEEGQHVPDGRNQFLYPHRWDETRQTDWPAVRDLWERHWNGSGPIFLEKSPPNLLRADELADEFTPASFVVMMSDPYAFVESARRQPNRFNLVRGAKLWVKIAKHQKRNIEELPRTMHFTYRDFTTNTDRIVRELLKFMPELVSLEPERVVGQSLAGEEKEIKNLNYLQVRRLGARDISQINAILRDHPGLMEYFNYKYIQPSVVHSYEKLIAFGETWLLRILRKQNILTKSMNKRIEDFLTKDP